MTQESLGRSLTDFTVELDVYSGPYEWLLALILKDELEIFEVPLRELVASYLLARQPDAANGLERDTDFAGSAAALVLLRAARSHRRSTRIRKVSRTRPSRLKSSPKGSLNT